MPFCSMAHCHYYFRIHAAFIGLDLSNFRLGLTYSVNIHCLVFILIRLLLPASREYDHAILKIDVRLVFQFENSVVWAQVFLNRIELINN